MKNPEITYFNKKNKQKKLTSFYLKKKNHLT